MQQFAYCALCASTHAQFANCCMAELLQIIFQKILFLWKNAGKGDMILILDTEILEQMIRRHVLWKNH